GGGVGGEAGAALLAKLTDGAVAPGRVEEAPRLAALAPRPIRLRPERVQALLGMRIGTSEMRRRLAALGMTCQREGAVLVVTPPSWRGDLEIEEDLAEELARLGGYDRVPTTVPLVPAAGGGEGGDRRHAPRLPRPLAAAARTGVVAPLRTDPETTRPR